MSRPTAELIAKAKEMRRLWDSSVTAIEFKLLKTMETECALAIMDDAYEAEREELKRLKSEIDAWGCAHDHPTLLSDVEIALGAAS